MYINLFGLYKDHVDPVFVWLNETINPLTPLVELVVGKEYSKDGFVQPKSRITSAAQTVMVFIPGGRVAGASERAVANNVVKTGANTLIKAATQFSEHSLERLAERGVTQDMATFAINNGQKFYDPLTKTINYILPNGFASGKSLLVGTNPLTGEVTTVIRSSKNLINSRFVSIK